jgi:hypothetical protein
LVPEVWAIRKVAEADGPGIRIAVTGKSVEESSCVARCSTPNCEVCPPYPLDSSSLRSGDVDVLAAPRPALLPLSTRLPGSRVLKDRFDVAFVN